MTDPYPANVRHVTEADGSQEIWDGRTNMYQKWDSEGQTLEQRPLTAQEITDLDPQAAIKSLTDAVDQLILDQLLGGF